MVVHGALDYAELAAQGIRPDGLLDFSSNINPFGPPQAVRGALAALDPAPYPDRSSLGLRQALAARHGCAVEAVLVGNGSNELIHLVPRALLPAGAATLIVEPTFGEYGNASRLAGAQVIVRRADRSASFKLDITLLAGLLLAHRPRIVWLCDPNNPTGTSLLPAQIELLAETCAAVEALLVVDRAYAAFLRAGDPQRDPLDGCGWPNLLRLCSLTKSYALAGLRLGYLLGAPELLARVAAYQPAWSVGSAAQAAGLAALAEPDFLATTLPQLWQCSDDLYGGLLALGLEVWRDGLPFMLVRTGDGAATRAALLRRGVVVRDCASFGLPEYVRVAPRSREDNLCLLRVWGEN